MSQHHERGAVFCAQNLIPRIEEVGQIALRTSRVRYSSGFPDFEGGSERKLGHNNERHNFIMGRDASRLLGHLGFNAFEQRLGRTTGEAHDRDQLGGRGNDEYKSGAWLEEQLCNAGVPARYARRAGLTVLGTEPIFTPKGIVMDQYINYLEFGSAEDELWAKAVVSADLSELYSPFGPYAAHRFYVQMQKMDAIKTPPMEGFADFLGGQLEMLAEYEFPLEEADALFATHRRQVCNYSEFLYQQARDQKIEDWKQVTDWDLRFMNNPDISLLRLN